MDYEPNIDIDSPPKISVSKGWPAFVREAILHIIAMARISIMHARHWPDGTLKLRSECDRLIMKSCCYAWNSKSRTLGLQRSICIVDRTIRHPTLGDSPVTCSARLEQEPSCPSFYITTETIPNWIRAFRDADPLVGDHDEVKPTRYPDYIRMIIQQIKAFFPTLGRDKIADMLGRVSLHISSSTVGRIIKKTPIDPSSVEPMSEDPDADLRPCGDIDDEPSREVIAKYPNHVFSVDITQVPIDDGYWVPWSPFAILQQCPFCWHVLSVIDHYSRHVIGSRVFPKAPTGQQVTDAMSDMAIKPKHIVTDRGQQFDCKTFHKWCSDRGIQWRHGKVCQHGSIAVIERFNRTIKTEWTRRIMVSNVLEDFVEELEVFVEYYNGERPHSRHDGKTPDEVYFGLPAVNSEPRIEPRPQARDHTPCARPRTKIANIAGANFRIEVSFYKSRRHLPMIRVVQV